MIRLVVYVQMIKTIYITTGIGIDNMGFGGKRAEYEWMMTMEGRRGGSIRHRYLTVNASQ